MKIEFKNQKGKTDKIEKEFKEFIVYLEDRKYILSKLSTDKQKAYIEKDTLLKYAFSMYKKLKEVFNNGQL